MLKKLGIGIDIVDINRFDKIPFNLKPNFYKKIFLSSEIKYCLKFKKTSEHFAGKFVLKEAVRKSISQQVSFLDIETYNTDSGPKIKIKNKKIKYNFLASLSHDGKYAVGVVLSEKIH